MSSRRDTIRALAEALAPLYDRREAEVIARTAVAESEGISPSHLLAYADEPCSLGEAEIARLTSELSAGRPLQYVLGHCEFCGLDFEVGEGVLIPRPETEELVAAVMERTKGGDRILDLCTGSGCIAVSLAAQTADAHVTAVDISPAALGFARRNAGRAGVDIEFLESDVLSGLPELKGRKFDIIVSNPPYVPQSDKAGMHANVLQYEPHGALFVADDHPLLFYETIADAGRTLLAEGGSLCFEIYEKFAGRVCRMLEQKGYRDVVALEDMNMKPRIVCSRR